MTNLLPMLVKFATGAAVGAVVKNVVAHTAPFVQSRLDKILTSAGALVLTVVVGDHCADRVEEMIFKKENDNGHE